MGSSSRGSQEPLGPAEIPRQSFWQMPQGQQPMRTFQDAQAQGAQPGGIASWHQLMMAHHQRLAQQRLAQKLAPPTPLGTPDAGMYQPTEINA